MLSVFTMQDRLRFEVFCYSLGADDDSRWRRELEDGVEHFKDVSDMTYFEASRLIRSDRIHILINLDGYVGYVGWKMSQCINASPGWVFVSGVD